MRFSHAPPTHTSDTHLEYVSIIIRTSDDTKRIERTTLTDAHIDENNLPNGDSPRLPPEGIIRDERRPPRPAYVIHTLNARFVFRPAHRIYPRTSTRMEKRILITGGAGFIASHVAIRLGKRFPNYKV